MDVVLQNFQRSFGLTTPFFKSLSIDPPVTMEELYQQADKYSTLEDNIRAASQTVMITAQSSKATTKSQPEQKGGQSKGQSAPKNNQKRKGILPNSLLLTSPKTGCSPSSGITPSLNGPQPCEQIWTNATGRLGVTITETMTMKQIIPKA